MAYAVLTESDLLSRAPGDSPSAAERLAAALTALEDEGYALVTVDRPPEGEALFVFTGHSSSRRLSNIR